MNLRKLLFVNTVITGFTFFPVSAEETITLSCKDAEVINIDGSTSKAMPGDILSVEKINGIGVTEIVWNTPIPVKKNLNYRMRLDVSMTDAAAGSIADIQIALYDSDGKLIKWNQPERYARNQVPLITLPGEFRETSGVIDTDEKSAFIKIKYMLAGNPMKVSIKNPTVFTYTPAPVMKGIYDKPDSLKSSCKDLLSSLEKIKPYEAWVEKKNGIPELFVNGKQTPFAGHFGNYDFSSFASAGVNIHILTNSGQNPYAYFWWDLPAYKNGKFDFSRLEENLLRIYDNDPKAKIIISVNCGPDRKWTMEHPDTCFRAEKNGPKAITVGCAITRFGEELKDDKEYFAQTYSSEEYQEHVKSGLKELGNFLKNSPAGKIVIGFFITGGHDGQFCPWKYGESPLDYSPSHLAAYRKWLKEKYESNEKLQKAWGDSKISFETAELYTKEEWSVKTIFSSAEGSDRKIVDAREFRSISVARMLKIFSNELKESFGRRTISMVYYSSAIWTQMTRLALDELAAGDSINAVVMVTNYTPYRQVGYVGGSGNFCVGSSRLRNLMFIQELDHRTWRSHGRNQPMLATAMTPGEFRSQILRDISAGITQGGTGFYYYDMMNSWYNDPACRDIIKESVELLKHSMSSEAPANSEVAIFLDEKLRFHSDLGTGDSAQPLWKMSGLTPDVYHLTDIMRNDLPEYRMYVFFSPVTADAKITEAIRKKALNSGKVCFITGLAAAASEKLGIESFFNELGMNVKSAKTPAKAIVLIENSSDKILKNVAPRIGIGGMIIDGQWLIYWNGSNQNLRSYIEDKNTVTLARWQADKLPAIGIRRTNDFTLIYSAMEAGITPELLHNAAKEAGIKPFAPAGNVTAVGHGIATVHRMSPLPAKIKMSCPVEFRKLDGSVFSKESTEIILPIKLGETGTMLYNPVYK